MSHDGAEPDEVKGEASDSRDVALRVVVADSETLDKEVSRKGSRMAQPNEAKPSDEMQGNEFNMDGIDEDLWQHIEAQLRSAEPVLGHRKWTVLHRAAARGLAEVVGRLLTACPFLINVKCVDGAALHCAARNGHTAVVTQLLAVSPTLAEAMTEGGFNALHCAALRNQPAIVTQLLAVNPGLAEARTHDVLGLTALHHAARGGHTAIVAQLLAANPALIDVRANDGETALHHAAFGGQTEMVAHLLALKPALIDGRSYQGRTALHAAAQNGHAAVVTQLLAANPALINERYISGHTALHYAAATTTAQLLAAKASTDARTDVGRTVLHEAVYGGHSEIVSQLLAANPALIDARTNDGSTVLHYASHDEIIAQLLAARPALLYAMINDVDSGTALLNAVKLGQEETAIRLLTMHPNLICSMSNHCGRRGWTVFHNAAHFAREKVMSWLLAAVSEPDLEQELLQEATGNMTALQVAAMRGHRNIVAQLLAACPSLIGALSHQTGFRESTMDILLEFKPALAHAVDAKGNTLLHSMTLLQHSKG